MASLSKLFREVGYGPKNGTSNTGWIEESSKSWEIQDRLLPGNYIGACENGRLIASTGRIANEPDSSLWALLGDDKDR